jgi:hypothetical protein
MFDFIGDVHGHADCLELLLQSLGYCEKHGFYSHPSRQAVFVGDLIDRGPKIARTLEIVKKMVDHRSALAILGNHELNAIAYRTRSTKHSGFLRPHSIKNTEQHSATLQQLTDSSLEDYVNWFRSLPLWLETDDFRVVHACWHPVAIANISMVLDEKMVIDNTFIEESFDPNANLFHFVETVSKGMETTLPQGFVSVDKDGTVRYRARTRWFLSPIGLTYREFTMDEIECDLVVPSEATCDSCPYSLGEKPLFIGHYWLRAATPYLLSKNIACLDFSVAKGGFLCAYRWNGETLLSEDNFVVAHCRP